MKKMSATTTLALLLVLILGSTVVYASFNWCPDDPVLDIGGTTVNVIVWIPEESVSLVNGPVKVKVYVPEGVETDVIEYGNSFGQGPEDVEFIPNGEWDEDDDEIKVKVEVLVPATEKLRVRVTIEAPGVSESKEGWSNEWVKCKAKVEVEWSDDDDHDDDDGD